MKKLFLQLAASLITLFFISCNGNGSQSESKKPDSTKKPTVEALKDICGDIKDWEIDSATADKLIKHRSHPGNDMSNIIDFNDCIRNKIMKAYPTGKGVWAEVRYKDLDDEIRYCKHWGIPYTPQGANDPSGKIKDHKTKIFVVSVMVNNVDPTYYYDIAKICPPPDDCRPGTDTTHQSP